MSAKRHQGLYVILPSPRPAALFPVSSPEFANHCRSCCCIQDCSLINYGSFNYYSVCQPRSARHSICWVFCIFNCCSASQSSIFSLTSRPYYPHVGHFLSTKSVKDPRQAHTCHRVLPQLPSVPCYLASFHPLMVISCLPFTTCTFFFLHSSFANRT